jgi:aminoglycoside 6'-N-acetyltransferase I
LYNLVFENYFISLPTFNRALLEPLGFTDRSRNSFMAMFHIRRARPGDRESWLRLRRALWPGCSAQKHELEMRQVLKSKGPVFLAENWKGRVIGLAEASVRRDHVDGASICPVPYLEAWYVDGRYRKQGVGKALMGAVERWAVSRGFRELASDAEIGNRLSIRLHRRLGFLEIDRNVTFLKGLRGRETN